jgi:hypothetical protein
MDSVILSKLTALISSYFKIIFGDFIFKSFCLGCDFVVKLNGIFNITYVSIFIKKYLHKFYFNLFSKNLLGYNNIVVNYYKTDVITNASKIMNITAVILTVIIFHLFKFS